MKRLHTLYLLAVALLFPLAACQSDDELSDSETNGTARVTLRIATADAAATTRAQGSTYGNWKDSENAKSDRSEMMYSWVVIITDGTGKVVFQRAKTIADAEKDDAEIDEVAEKIEMNVGSYTAYSFANISEEWLASKLGSISVGSTLAEATVKNAVATVKGNGFTPIGTNDNIANATENDLGGKGIPMSNMQTLSIAGTGTEANPEEKDLIVVRMLAKMEIQFYNLTDEVIKVKSVTISDVTKNAADNLRLLPNYGTTPDYPDYMEYHHKDLQPNVATGAETADFTVTKDITVPADYSYDGHKSAPGYKLEFYINESKQPTNADKLFFLTVELENGDYRYALVSQKGATTDDDDAWDYIARNDYRIIPVVLDDYRLEIIPYDFPAIGVYPASVKTIDEDAHLYEIEFHDYGHFHLLPVVYKGKDYATANINESFVTYSPTKGNFTSTVWSFNNETTALDNDAWNSVFKSYKADRTTVLTAAVNKTDTDVQFYGASGLPDDNIYPSTLPVYGQYFDGEVYHEVGDGDNKKIYSQGSFPLLDSETKWKPRATDADRPFLFGQIAPQVDGADKTVYHELRAYLYVKGATVPRQLIYRFYMHLKQDYGIDPKSSSDDSSPARRRRPAPCCHHRYFQ